MARVAEAGVIWIETSVAGLTVKVAVLEVTPFSAAVILDVPAATAVAIPAVLIVAVAAVAEFHDTDEVMSWVGPTS
jgi:hypothetical protein